MRACNLRETFAESKDLCMPHILCQAYICACLNAWLRCKARVSEGSTQLCYTEWRLGSLHGPDSQDAVSVATVQGLTVGRPLQADAVGHLGVLGLQVELGLQVVHNRLALEVPYLQPGCLDSTEVETLVRCVGSFLSYEMREGSRYPLSAPSKLYLFEPHVTPGTLYSLLSSENKLMSQ